MEEGGSLLSVYQAYHISHPASPFYPVHCPCPCIFPSPTMSDTLGEPGPGPIDDNVPIPPREQLVKTAAKFLSSRNVVNSANENKVAFLKKKGLSDAEIDLAMRQAEVIMQSRNFDSNVYAVQNSVQPYPSTWQHQPSWMKYRDIGNSVALVGGLAYAVYWFYKKYLEPFFFGGGKKGLDSRLSDLDKMITNSLSDLKSSVSRVRDDMERLTERRVESLSRQIDELKNEVASLKKLMLSRKQFPSATVSGPLTIPSWQLASAAEEKEVEEEGAGSGTNGSDSSLEMIKE